MQSNLFAVAGAVGIPGSKNLTALDQFRAGAEEMGLGLKYRSACVLWVGFEMIPQLVFFLACRGGG